MFLSQQVEECTIPDRYETHTEYKVTLWRVVLDAQERPIWTTFDWHGPYYFSQSARSNGRKSHPKVPFMKGPAHNKLVTMAQAMKLVGVTHPMAALDRLRELVKDDPDNQEVQNFVETKEPKPKPEKVPPLPSQIKLAESQRAAEKAAEYERKRDRMERLRLKWEKKARQLNRRALKLQDEGK